MILLALLFGGGIFLALHALFGQPVVIATGCVLFGLVLLGIGSDLYRAARDRATGLHRLDGWEVGR